MFYRLFLLATISASLSSSLGAAGVWFSQAPSSVQSGTGYYVEASASTSGQCDVTVWKNNGYFASGSGYMSSSAGNSTTDYGEQTVEYYADVTDYTYDEYESTYAWVTITAPPNNAPSISWSQSPANAAVNEWFTIEAHGTDSDGNLTAVSVWREGSPHAFGGGGDGYNSWSGNGSSSGSVGSVTFTAEAYDSNGASSGMIYHTINIYQPNQSPTVQWQNAPSAAVTGQWFNFQARGDDPDGNISWVYVWKDGQPFAFNGFANGYTQYSDNNAAMSTTPGTITFTAQSGDSNGATSGVITAYTYITDGTAPSVPGGLGSGSITGTTFTLSWSASTDNVGVTAYQVMRDTTDLGITTGTSMAISGLTQGTTYGMKVRARDAANNWSAWSSVLNVQTTDTQAPTVPSGLASVSVTATGFTLNWTASTDNLGVTAYEVMRDSTTLTPNPTTNTVGVTGLTQGTTYAMKVRARDAAGNWSSWSTVLNVQTTDTQAPSVPAGLASASISTTSFTLNWTASTDNVGVTEYEVRRDSTVLTPNPTTATKGVSGLTAATTYAMTVRARDAAGNWSAWSSALNVTTLTTSADADNDGMPNGWEVTYGLNPNSAADATGNPDGDAANNLIEYLLGTNPTVAESDASNQTQAKIHRPNP